MRYRLQSDTNTVSGSALSEVLLVLLVASIMVAPVVSAMRLVPRFLSFQDDVQDEIALSQMRRILMLSYKIEAQGSTLAYTYQDREFTLSMVNGNLIIQPGTQMILPHIAHAYFESDGEVIYVVYTREDQERKAPLVHV